MDTLQEIISESTQNRDFIYRGCACQDYDLVPTLARRLKSNTSFDQYSVYAGIVEKEAKKGYIEVNMNGKSNDLSQHYGLETSYLDWSYSVYVALYFAFTSYLKKFVDENILDQQIDHSKMCILREKFNNHNYCIYMLNKGLYDEMACKHPNLPLKVYDTDPKNERMEAQQGLLSTLDGKKVNDGAKIQSSQIKILADWLQSNYPADSLEQVGNKYLWNKKILLKKLTYKLPQRDRVCLQKSLKENKAISTKLFPDFEGVKKNIEFSEDYNILRDWSIAYQEPAPHSLAKSKDEIIKMLEGDQNVIDSNLNTDQLKEGEFFPFQ